jgi:cell division protein FtsA
LTGGTSLLPGISELAEQIFDMPARKGIPMGVGGLSDIVNSPAQAIGVGLIIYGNNQLGGDSIYRKTTGVFGNVARTVKKMFSEFF